MRRAWLPLVWLLGTATAVVVGWSAVQAVASQVIERRPEPLSAQAVQKLEGTPATSQSPESAPAAPHPGPTVSPSSPLPVTGPPPTPNGNAGSPPTPAQSRSSRIFTLQGGTASVSCLNNQITLDWATPNAGFQVEVDRHDGSSVLEVRFTSDSHESKLETWCSGGQVQFSVEEKSS